MFGQAALGGIGGVSLAAQLIGIGLAVLSGLTIYGELKTAIGIRLSEEEEFRGADLAIHKISATPRD